MDFLCVQFHSTIKQIYFYVISLQLNRLEIRFALNILQDTYYL